MKSLVSKRSFWTDFRSRSATCRANFARSPPIIRRRIRQELAKSHAAEFGKFREQVFKTTKISAEILRRCSST